MKPQDILMLYSHVSFAVEDSEVESMLVLASKISSLKPKQVMLIFHMKEQRVWSVVNCSLGRQWMVIYSCQPHSSVDGQEYGGIIYRFSKTWLQIIHILTLMEEHSGVSLEGSIHVLVLQEKL